jgi:hypothetical protein
MPGCMLHICMLVLKVRPLAGNRPLWWHACGAARHADWSIRQHNIMENVQQVIQACTSRMFDNFVQGFPF